MRAIRMLPTLCTLLLATQPIVFSQSLSIRIAGVAEPPELTGEPKKVRKPTETQQQFGKIIEEFKDEEKAKAVRPKLDKFIEEHPNYSDAHFMRATCDLCILNRREYASVLEDIDTAISTHSLPISETIYDKLTDHYSLRGKIEFATGRYREAMDDLDTSMKLDLGSADKIFNLEGVAPETTSKPCTWNLTDLDTLVATFPQDYRSLLFRGLYFEFFTTFKEDYYAKALEEFRKAAILNPKSPLPHYFIGRLYTKASFWTKAAWSSDEKRNEAYREAIQAFITAIRLDSNFRPAYEMRASDYEGLKQYPQAIKDYDKVLELDPENVTAYADRGLAKLEIGQYLGATIDLGDAIRRQKDEDSALGMSYEYRADAYMKMGDYRNAIADYSKAIERQLASQTFLLSLKQIRGLYPEYNGVSDETLCRKINALFWPEFEYNVIAKNLLQENGKWEISLLNDLYEKRGDAYLRANDFRRGVLDFNRIFYGIPNFASVVDRWRFLGASPGGEKYYLDVKSVESADNGRPARLWLKHLDKKQTYTVVAYEMECKRRQINQISTVVYDSGDKMVSSSELSDGWQRIVPDTIGEQLYNGLCSDVR